MRKLSSHHQPCTTLKVSDIPAILFLLPLLASSCRLDGRLHGSWKKQRQLGIHPKSDVRPPVEYDDVRDIPRKKNVCPKRFLFTINESIRMSFKRSIKSEKGQRGNAFPGWYVDKKKFSPSTENTAKLLGCREPSPNS